MQRNYVELIEKLKPTAVVKILFDKQVLTKHDVEILTAEGQKRSTRNTQLIDLLTKRGPRAVPEFYFALFETNQPELAKLIENDVPENERINDNYVQLERDGIDFHNSGSSSSDPTTDNGKPDFELHLDEDWNDATGIVFHKAISGPGRRVVRSKRRLVFPADPLELPQFNEEKIYRNFSSPKGLGLIINNREFSDAKNNRPGSELDVDSMRNMMAQLGYDHFVVQNMNAKTMLHTVQQFAFLPEHDKYDSTMLIIMTHGAKGGLLFGTDMHSVHEEELLKPFSLNKSLLAKPKLMFLQACRGDTHGSPADCDAAAVSDPDHKFGHASCDEDAADKLNRMLNDDEKQRVYKHAMAGTDIFIGYSTLPGYYSMRRGTGSWYIQTVEKLVLELACTTDLLTIMTRVNNEVYTQYKHSESGTRQCPNPTSRLRKDFYFYPKLTQPHSSN